MAELGAVYDITPAPRSPADILATDDRATPSAPAPTARNKWLTASVVDDAASVVGAVFDEAQRRDPGHPWVALVRVSKGGAIRILFAFDPQRQAVLLVGGDKTGQWTGWYEDAIPVADNLFDEYLSETGQSCQENADACTRVQGAERPDQR